MKKEKSLTLFNMPAFGAPLRALAAGTVLAALVVVPWGGASAGTLENLERERAIMLETILSGNITPAERATRVAIEKTRLVDLESMVLRDKSLIGRNTPQVRAAFDNYDLTFLVHASAEKGQTVADHWMSELGLSTQAMLNARMGRR